MDIQPLLTNADFRAEVLQYVTDSSLLNFWYKEFYAMPPAMRAEAVSPIINKIGLFQTHPLIRNIVGQSVSSFSVKEIMDNRKIFIANLSKGVLGEDGTQLLGSLLVTQFQTAALERINQPIHLRTPFYLYVDEVHSFITLSFIDILSEARKFQLCLFLTHQYIEQLDEQVRAAIFGNVGTLICFRIGAQDAKILEEEFKPIFNADDLLRLPQYAIYIKLLIDGTTSQPFSANALPLPNKVVSYKSDIISYSRAKYSSKVIHQPRKLIQPIHLMRPKGLFD